MNTCFKKRIKLNQFSHLSLLALLCLCSCNSDNNKSSDATDGLISKNIFFDDFNYENTITDEFKNFGWHVRSGLGNPGPEGAIWSDSFISIQEGPVNKVLRLEAEIKDTVLIQSELNFKEQKMFEGTYAARVHYTNKPDTGIDGAGLVQAGFWLFSNYSETLGTERYSEIDFEYLPNGGWGYTDEPVMHLTSWYLDNPKDNIHQPVKGDFSGWHTFLITIADGKIKYYDGAELLAEQGSKYYPRCNMNIVANLWFIDNVDKSINSKYHIDID